MFLKTLTLKGFKSFAESTTLDLEPGITVVVGPNGSGKSNIVDAVAWVLGAQGARTMRSNKMEDVIFAGTSKKAALGRAEVSLTIDNSSGLLPIEFAEVTITRTLFRSGESEYAINGVGCRLLDIQELLSDTGVGRQQHVIVSQGQLAAILDSRPEDRRAVIEEAAGILKYRKRRERAQRRLEATESSFVRLGDLLREIRRQLRPLERQAESARKHEEMTVELRAIRLHLAGRELAGLRTRSETSTRVKTELGAREAQLRAELSRLDTDVLLAESQLSAMGGAATAVAADDPFSGVDLGDVLSRAEALYEKARGQLALLGERRRGIERDRNAFVDQGVVESLSAEAARLIAELERVETEANDLPPLFLDLADQEHTLAEERDVFLSAWGADDAAEGDRSGPGSAELRSELNAHRQATERARADVVRLDVRSAAVAERIERLGREAAALEIEIEALVADVGEGDAVSAVRATAVATAARESADAELAVIEGRVRACEDDLRATEGERRAWQARVEALSAALDEARARAGAQRLAGLDGIVGTLLDLVDIDAGWEAAFEAAVGETIAAVVVRDRAAGRAALARLHESNLSGAVFALGTVAVRVGGRGSGVGLLVEVPGSEAVRGHVRAANPEVSAALDALLEGAYRVAGGWTDALDAALANPDAVIVTPSGDRFAGTGWRAGAGSSGATGVALDEANGHAARAVSEAVRAADALAEMRGALGVARATAAQARDQQQSAVADHQRKIASLVTARASHQRALYDHREASVELVAVEGQRADLAARMGNDESRISALETMLPGIVEAENEVALRQNRRREASQRLDSRSIAVGSLRRGLEVRAAGIEERRRILVARQDEIDERLSRSVSEREVAERRRYELDLLAERTEALHAVVLERGEQLEGGLVELRERRRLQNEAARAATSKLDGLRRDRHTAESDLAAVRERVQKGEIELAEIRLRLETLVEQIRREFDVEPDRTLAAECPPMPDAATAPTTRARDLERELRLLGPINPLALDEFTSLQERHALIVSELEDVKTARRDLSKVIRAIDEEIVTVFTAAYADVADNFAQLFGALFPGGHGLLRLTDPDNPLETGVEVEARPSGKNVRKLSLLSGGERSLVAMAFLFAVFRSRPSPFYLMDEVEAALDDVNLHRFLTLLHEFRDEAQLLVVSHQKRTMEAADCLYGVSMQPGGSSKVVSEKVVAHV